MIHHEIQNFPQGTFWSYDFEIVHNPPDTKARFAQVVLKVDII